MDGPDPPPDPEPEFTHVVISYSGNDVNASYFSGGTFGRTDVIGTAGAAIRSLSVNDDGTRILFFDGATANVIDLEGREVSSTSIQGSNPRLFDASTIVYERLVNDTLHVARKSIGSNSITMLTEGHCTTDPFFETRCLHSAQSPIPFGGEIAVTITTQKPNERFSTTWLARLTNSPSNDVFDIPAAILFTVELTCELHSANLSTRGIGANCVLGGVPYAEVLPMGPLGADARFPQGAENPTPMYPISDDPTWCMEVSGDVVCRSVENPNGETHRFSAPSSLTGAVVIRL